MYLSDRDALQYASRLILILVPFFSSLLGTWSWLVEILLLFAVFIHARSSRLRLTVVLLSIGYIGCLIPGDIGLAQIGFAPWAGVLLLWLKERGLPTSHSLFWSLMTAGLLSALPTIPVVIQALQPENMQQNIQSAIELYEQQGTIAAIEKQGMSRLEFEKYLNIFVPMYYQLVPAVAALFGMIEIGTSYWIYRLSTKRIQGMRPFMFYRLPWYTIWLAILGIAAYLGGDYLKAQALVITGMNIMAVSAAISLFIGLSCLAFFSRHPKVPRFLFLLIIMSIIFLPSYVMIALLMIGLFDPVFNFRRIPEKNEGVKP